jgi:glutamate--cysteine ligase
MDICMARDVVDAQGIESRDDLVAWFEGGSKPASEFRVGAEHEKVVFDVADRSPVPYEGERGIGALLGAMADSLGWDRIEDGGALIGLFDSVGGGAISLEPGGQYELSGAPQVDVHGVASELAAHMEAAHAAAAPLGIGFLSLGMSPKWTLQQTPVMPKSRYRIMTRYMPLVGTRGLDMMYRTATVQANLDYGDEADMVAKLRVGLALQPAITALFANSPFTDGALNGLMSFVKRGPVYHDVAGASFRDLLAGRLEALPGERATISDWANHLSTIFPEVRLKRYLEMRGADVGPPDRIVALSALMVGIYYDSQALADAGELIKDWSAEQRRQLRDDAPRMALRARVGGRSLAEVARDMLAISRAGLARRARLDGAGRGESVHLDCLDRIAAEERVPAEDWIARFEGPWEGSVDPAFTEARM